MKIMIYIEGTAIVSIKIWHVKPLPCKLPCLYIHVPNKKETQHAELIRSKAMPESLSFISVQRYVRYFCITHLSQPGVKMCYSKLAINQIVKSHRISVFIMLYCWISSCNGNRLSRPNGTICLQIRSSIPSYAIIERLVAPENMDHR